ncbi:hypothetical protein BUALT_Bualt11G0027600 [Buddleja alternifolia]|uniref:Uncharacterized protein n=1 Tax=Buddleja alternifolia TaxID=168488 RepID=A0AAV6X2U7_9LAMI|nr:hypothetical protein BUALT_Bualt11G0027600 [Buddleja alternifolia]
MLNITIRNLIKVFLVHVSSSIAKCDVFKFYEMEKEKFKRILPSTSSRICLTSDMWSSLVSNGYMEITAHYIDNNWVLQKKVLVYRHFLLHMMTKM